ncbi:MAG: Na/Pi cotransporter family protein [Firmicutes bacterium]|nr:Na/Pi cotransporter family protein [Bacillota bacterium]
MRELVFGVLGGLALFIYGMNLMGEGLKKVAGQRLRQILEAVTKNPLIGVIVGTVVTAIIQSSSATTVMVVGFVNAGLMSLTQAIGVIMGANIGTTMTAQLIAFKIGDYAYPIAALGFVLYFFGRRRQLRSTGQVILGFGILFIGLNIMSHVLKPLATSTVFQHWITSLGRHRLLGVLVGMVMTMIVQSSSATIGVLQSLASQPVPVGETVRALISLPIAVPILLGDNIGTTVTALLASIGANRAAKRAAVSHTLFNVFGTVICLLVFPLFIRFVYLISPHPHLNVTEADVIARQIANAHTLFNTLNTVLWLPFVGVLAWIVQKIVPGEDEVVEKGVKYLDPHVVGNAEVALGLSVKELVRMGRLAQGMLSEAEKLVTATGGSPPKPDLVLQAEDTLDDLQARIIHYLSVIVARNTLTERQSNHLANLMHVTGDIERIGDHCTNLAELAVYKYEEKIAFSEAAQSELKEVFALTAEMFTLSLEGLEQKDLRAAEKVLELEKVMNDLEKKCRENHMARLRVGICSPDSAVCFTELMKNLERIADHCNNIAEAVLDRRPHTLVR